MDPGGLVLTGIWLSMVVLFVAILGGLIVTLVVRMIRGEKHGR